MSGKRAGKELKRMRTVTPEEAQRAIYIDFEGFEDQVPAIVGYLVDGEFSQVVTTTRWTYAILSS